MSRPAAPTPQSHYGGDDPSRRFHHQQTPNPSPTQSHPGPHRPYQRDGYRDGPDSSAMSVSLPPLRHMSSTPPTPSSDRRAGNPLGVHSILNPQADLVEQQRDQRRSASQRGSMSPIDPHPPQSLPSISRPPSVDSTQAERMSNPTFQPPHPPHQGPPRHHMHNPRSPPPRRAQSMSLLKPSTNSGLIDARQSPFAPAASQSYGPELSSSQPVATPPVVSRSTYFPTVPPTVPPTAPTPPPNMLRRPSSGFRQSGSASPMASYSPYSQAASIASSQYETSSQPGTYITTQSNAPQDGHNPPIAMETERSMIPMGPSGQSSIQILTIKSQGGHHVQIPVDVQAASKVADEKRKRNAGASARFRARRKEKEREASMSISRLEQQLRQAAEDVEYYRAERDFFKTIVFQQPGAERHYARPPSPRLRRPSLPPSVAPSTVGGGSAGSYSDHEDDESIDAQRNVRRRTSTYHPAPGGPPPAQYPSSGPPPQTHFAPSFPPVNSPHMSRPPPPQQFDPRDQRPRPDVQQPSLRNPFGQGPAPHDNRNWRPAAG